MLCLTVLPILGLWGFSVYTLTDIVKRKTENEKTKFQLQLSVELGKLIHHLQQERDMSVLYLSDLGPETKTFLLTEYMFTDKAIDALSEWPADLDNKKRTEFESKGKLQEYLKFHRQLLSKDTFNLHVEIEFYTKVIDVVIVWLYKSITRGQFAVVWKTLVAYLKLTSGKQDVGIERALGTLFFVQGGFKTREYFEMYNNRISRFKALYTTAELYSARVDRLYTSGVKMVETNITGIISNFRNEIQHHTEEATYPDMEKARYWFDNMTIYLDTLLEIQRDLGYEIIDILDIVIDQSTNNLAVSAAFLFVVLVMCPLVIYITENLTSSIQRYGLTLVDRTNDLRKEKKRSDGLLYQMVPALVADKLKKNIEIDPEYFSSVTILFLDIFGFNRISSECSPNEIVVLMNSVYGTIDELLEDYNVYKVETIKDCYMVASGIPTRNEDRHSSEVADLALEMLQLIQTKRFSVSGNRYVQLLIGVNTGPCMTGIIGAIMPRYCVLGETVNFAAKMKMESSPNKIHITQATNNALKKAGNYVTKERGLINIRGKGDVMTFWLRGKTDVKTKTGEVAAMDDKSETDFDTENSSPLVNVTTDNYQEERPARPNPPMFGRSGREEKVTATIYPTSSMAEKI
ncbi:uncharacterized protein LOC110458877 [Mizuhopecten yessoensis]|uniref:uncharacterized protein LOC110458877 n=1 Tax=Mizuhopecten yessoensis TaxID=6573 RepID=UPI000B45A1FA|nr:uncharacterized protein LOC110458877 [Mizuhopecten yessoensis]